MDERYMKASLELDSAQKQLVSANETIKALETEIKMLRERLAKAEESFVNESVGCRRCCTCDRDDNVNTQVVSSPTQMGTTPPPVIVKRLTGTQKQLAAKRARRASAAASNQKRREAKQTEATAREMPSRYDSTA